MLMLGISSLCFFRQVRRLRRSGVLTPREKRYSTVDTADQPTQGGPAASSVHQAPALGTPPAWDWGDDEAAAAARRARPEPVARLQLRMQSFEDDLERGEGH